MSNDLSIPRLNDFLNDNDVHSLLVLLKEEWADLNNKSSFEGVLEEDVLLIKEDNIDRVDRVVYYLNSYLKKTAGV